ncbi:hypothetical protein [Corynebacterium halotolerans]|uniref:Uncharacterized protein n=1 Tax=Corynebacterium halotolerans YIM 70093 = DSM 44683 TaxID=1121362 RepID=M1MU72_9CORY|nr:hypothetical protein [Corynebacterium halotolerans]AGF71274.1 Hypothetical protein A605_01300 [Corynebacterium halotolerans YIM 70093 = DSM 44683]
MSGQRHAVIAVVDRGTDVTVVWHVQTDPDAPTGALSGAWILGPDDVDPQRLDDLLADTVVLPVGDADVGKRPTTSLPAIADAMSHAVDEVKARAKAAKEANKSLTLPRLDAVELSDPDELAENFQGEEVGRAAWSTATALAELIEQWHTIEGQRRSRKHLQEAFGAEVRPLPLG